MSIQNTILAVSRFGLGAKPGELKQVGNDPRGWLIEQLSSPVIPKDVTKRYGGMDYFANPTGQTKVKIDKEKLKEFRKEGRIAYIKETGDRVLAQIKSDQPFVERMVIFWSNHFTVSIQKPVIAGIVNQYEVEAIRPNINKRFEDMLLAVVRHPAMLVYLDNAGSKGADSKIGMRLQKGLNENLAREILELHTMGVGSGYKQDDVIALAKIITGWSINRGSENFGFRFNTKTHEPGPKTLLGKIYNDEGEEEGIRALTMLARHPATAHHIATKLVRHFVSDNPPDQAVKTVSQTYMSSGGDLKEIMKAVVNLDDVWKSPGTKIKTPYEYMISALRLTGVQPAQEDVVKELAELNFRAFNAASPAGYDDIAAIWAAPDAILKRIEWGHKLAQKLPAGTDPLKLANETYSSTLSTLTKQEIMRAASGVDGIALLLASPEFQRR